jgi:hypothetical protein
MCRYELGDVLRTGFIRIDFLWRNARPEQPATFSEQFEVNTGGAH